MKLNEELRQKYPGKGRRADYENSLRAAVDLFYLACMGGSRTDVTKCDAFDCFLWPYRPGKDGRKRPEGTVPSVDRYDQLSAAKTNSACVEALVAARKEKEGRGAEQGAKG